MMLSAREITRTPQPAWAIWLRRSRTAVRTKWVAMTSTVVDASQPTDSRVVRHGVDAVGAREVVRGELAIGRGRAEGVVVISGDRPPGGQVGEVLPETVVQLRSGRC